jgi:hypothetical protein
MERSVTERDGAHDRSVKNSVAAGRRINVSLPLTLHAKLDEARQKTHADTLTDVIRNALLLYLALVNERINGNDIIVRSQDGKETKYSVFLD